MACKYKVGSKEFETLQDFKDFVLQNGMGVFLDLEVSPQARTVLQKFNYDSQQESVAEMIARLNFQRDNPNKEVPTSFSSSEIEKQIFPSGQLTDYATQAQIHRNTYSGVKITGIAANSGKMGGYVFESTPVKNLIDTNTNEVFTPSYPLLRSKYGVESTNELLDKHPYIRVHEREVPSLREGAHIKIDGTTYSTLSRLEDQAQHTNIFELVDMIINLAIDNVKEQKLFVLGITNSNANAFLSALFMGIPLNSVVRMFTTPTMAELSTKPRLNKTDYVELAASKLKTFTVTSAAKALDEYFEGNVPTSITKKLTKASDLDAYLKIFADLGPSSSVLEKVYIGKASKELHALSDYTTLKQLSRLALIGEEFFVYAQLFSLLRSLPASKARIDYLTSKIQEYSEFSYLKGTELLISERILSSVRDIVKQSDLYQSLLAADPQQADQMLNEQTIAMKDNPLFQDTLATRSSKWFSNRVIRAQNTMYLKPTSKSVFNNVTPLAIPHVYQAYKAMLVLSNILESGFFVYSPVLQSRLVSILTKIGKIDADTPKSRFYFDLIDNTAKEFLKFVNSTVELQVDEHTITLDASKLQNDTATVRGITYKGIEGWSQQLIKKLMTYRDNDLIRNLEVITDSNTGLNRLGITADKINDDEIREQLKASFEELYKTNPEIALDLFKYAVMSQGLYYGRTALGRIFPARFIVAFSKAMEERIALLKGNSDVEFLSNLQAVEDQFLHQFVSFTAEGLPYVRGQKPMMLSNYKDARGKTNGVMKGEDNINGTPVYYDLKYEKIANSYPRIVKRFGDSVYAKLDVPSDKYVYYRVFAKGSIHNTYSFYPSDLSTGVNLQALLTPQHNVLYGITTLNNNVFEYAGPKITRLGEEVYIPVMHGSLPTALLKVQITKIDPIIRSDEEVANRYSYTVVDTISLTNEVQANRAIALSLDLASRESAVKVIPVSKLLRNKSKNVITVASDTSTLNADDNTFILRINALTALAGERFKEELDSTLLLISKLPLKAAYTIQDGILEPLKLVNISAARQLAVALFKATGYVDPMIEEEQEFTTTDRLFAELDYVLNKNEIISPDSFTIDGENITITVSELAPAVSRKLAVGNLLKVGYTNNTTLYAHISSIEDGVAKGTLFGESTLRRINKAFLTPNEFEEVLLKTQPC